MKLAKEEKEIDFIIKSEPWSEKDLADFRELMQKIKRRSKIKKEAVREKSAKSQRTRKAA